VPRDTLPHKPGLYLRSGLFSMLFVLSVVVYAGLALFVVPLPFRHRYRLLTNWADLNLWFCARICRLKYRVEGLENIPNRPSVIMAAHQSTWETLALQQLFAHWLGSSSANCCGYRFSAGVWL